MKAVLDTNVLVSGLINASGPPGRIVDLMRAGSIVLMVDDRIMAEYRDVLRRDNLQQYFSSDDREAIIDYVEHEACRVIAEILVHDLPDAGDIPFLEIALAAEAPLVTGNKKHFPRNQCKGCRVLDPNDFLRTYFA